MLKKFVQNKMQIAFIVCYYRSISLLRSLSFSNNDKSTIEISPNKEHMQHVLLVCCSFFSFGCKTFVLLIRKIILFLLRNEKLIWVAETTKISPSDITMSFYLVLLQADKLIILVAHYMILFYFNLNFYFFL